MRKPASGTSTVRLREIEDKTLAGKSGERVNTFNLSSAPRCVALTAVLRCRRKLTPREKVVFMQKKKKKSPRFGEMTPALSRAQPDERDR